MTFTQAPVILALSSIDVIHWKLSVAPGVRLDAVILAGVNNATIEGLPAGTLLYETYTTLLVDETFFVNTWGDDNFARCSEKLGRLADAPLVTAIGTEKFDGQAILVGPENQEWRDQRLVWQTLPIQEKSTQLERAQLKNRLGGLRFQGIQFVPRPVGQHPVHADTTPLRAEFSIFGPIRSTMRPLTNVRLFVANEKGDRRFAINGDSKLVVYDDDPDKQQAIAWPDELEDDFRVGALAFDTKRNRLLIGQYDAPHELWGYSLENAAWERVGRLPGDLPSLRYVPELDELLAITSVDEGGLHDAATDPNSWPAVLRLSTQGELRERIRLATNIGVTSVVGTGRGATLSFADNRLLVLPPPRPNIHFRLVQPVSLIDWDTKQVIYSGEMTPHTGIAREIPFSDMPPAPEGGGALIQLLDNLARTEAGIAAYRAAHGEDAAGPLRKMLTSIRDRIDGRYDQGGRGLTEAHVVCVQNSSRGMTVAVTQRACPTILVLCADDPANWTIEVAEGARIERILLTGDSRQVLTGVSPGTPVSRYFREDRTADSFQISIYNTPSDRRDAFEAIKRLTGFAPTTLQFGGGDLSRLTVGPTSVFWRLREVDNDFRQLLSQLPVAPDSAEAKLGSLQFQAVWTPPAVEYTEFGTFTPRGPLAGRLRRLPVGIEQACADDRSGDVYGRIGPRIMRVNSGASNGGEISPAIGEGFWGFTAMALDTRRRRLLSVTSGQGGTLHAYDLTTRQWSATRRLDIAARAMAYDHATDTLYALNWDYQDRAALARYSPDGVLLGHTMLQGDEFGRMDGEPRLQLAIVDGRAVLIGALPSRADDATELRSWVVDTETGQILLSTTAVASGRR